MASTDQHASGAASERNKYKSPPPPPLSSMTPPPTSQASQAPQARTPTPTHSHLSSPPPTVKAASVSRSLSDSTIGMFSRDQITNATSGELRSMVDEVTAAYREAKASAAHHNLQYTLLSMETSETMKRMAVELEMTQKEVEVLQRTHLATPTLSNAGAAPIRSTSPNDHIILDLKNAYRLLEIENDNLRRRLSDAKIALVEREEGLSEENDRLRERIRENRNHIHMLRRSIGIPDISPPSRLNTTYVAPGQQSMHQSPSRQSHCTHHNISSTPKARKGDNHNFEALLLADQVLSQESTPTGHHSRSNQRNRNIYVVPSTPVNQKPAFVPCYSAAAQTPHSPPKMHLITPSPHRPIIPRRQSRDSTISASDAEDDPLNELDVDSSAKELSPSPVQPRPAAADIKGGAKSSSGFRSGRDAGSIVSGSPIMEKRKRKLFDQAVVSESPRPKRTRLGEGVGLGIAGLGSPVPL